MGNNFVEIINLDKICSDLVWYLDFKGFIWYMCNEFFKI